MSNSIVEKQFYALKIRLSSPMNVSSGNDENSDSDVMRNGSSELFIPGTSLAGAFREALGLTENEEGIMGFADGENGKMSSIFVSDLYLNHARVTMRDGVSLNADKTVDNKFDMEIIETGATGTIYIECVVRETQNANDFTNAIKQIVMKLQDGNIRIGSRKNRGFGRIMLDKENNREFVYAKFFQAKSTQSDDNRTAYYSFMQQVKNIDFYDKYEFRDWCSDITYSQDYIKIQIPLKLSGGISIRKYSAKPKESDYEQITCNDVPVIPGSSWNGAIRSAIRETLLELHCKNVDDIIARWFGYTKSTKPQNAENDAEQSLIIIGESILENAQKVPIRRNKINRFSAATVEGALYKETTWFGGNTTLEIMVKKEERKAYKAFIGILQIIIDDLCNGYLPIGGLVSVGRGIFESNGEVTYSEEVEDNLSALYALVTQEA